eukprot:tig00000444_g799.t1
MTPEAEKPAHAAAAAEEDPGFDFPVGGFDHLDDRARDVLDFPCPDGVVVRHQRAITSRVSRLANVGITGIKSLPSLQIGAVVTSQPPPMMEDEPEAADASGAKQSAADAAKAAEVKAKREAEAKAAAEAFAKQVHHVLMTQFDVNNRALEANLEAYFPNSMKAKLAALTSQASHASAANAMIGYETPWTCAELKASSDENVVGASILKGITRNLSAGAELFYTFKRGGGAASLGMRHVRPLPGGGERSIVAYANMFGQLTASYYCHVTPTLRVATRTEYSVLQDQLSFSAGVDCITPIGVRLNTRVDSARGVAAAVSLGVAQVGVVLSCSALAPENPRPSVGMQLFVS